MKDITCHVFSCKDTFFFTFNNKSIHLFRISSKKIL